MDGWFEDFEEYAEPQQAARQEREPLPEGEYEFLIKDVTIGEEFKLALVHEDKRYSWVWCRLFKDSDWAKALAATLIRSLGMTPAQWRTADPSDIADRLVRAEIYHKVASNGRTYVNVRRFMPAEQPAPKPEPVKKAPPRTAGEKHVAKAMDGNDDIPF